MENYGCFNDENLQVLKGRKVILFPDFGAWDDWLLKYEKVKTLNIDVEIFDFLENMQRSNNEKKDMTLPIFYLR